MEIVVVALVEVCGALCVACEQELGLCSRVGSCTQAGRQGRLAAKIQGLGVNQTNKGGRS